MLPCIYQENKLIIKTISKMKIKNLLAVVWVACAFTACNDDKNEDIPMNEIVAGKYEGHTKAVFAYMPEGQYAANQTVMVTANEDGTCNVSYTSDSFGTFTIGNATVKTDNGKYVIDGEGVTLMGMAGREPTEYLCTLAGNIDAAKESPSFVFTIPAVMGGLTVTFAKGDVPE